MSETRNQSLITKVEKLMHKIKKNIFPDSIDGQEIKESIIKKVNALVGESIIKNIKGWKISYRKNKFVVPHFPGAKTNDMKSYVFPTIKQSSETIVIHCGTNEKPKQTT